MIYSTIEGALGFRPPTARGRRAAMMKLVSIWEKLRGSLWFLPSLIMVASGLLAIGLLEADAALYPEIITDRFPLFFGARAEAARALLAAIASSMINIAGVTFSITIVALALASSQYTSRILRNFMRDRASQTVLGVFVGVFTYCVIVLMAIRNGEDGFVPSLSIVVAVALALSALGFFIFFIHHIAASIQAANIISAVARDTIEAIERVSKTNSSQAMPELRTRKWSSIPASRTGYVQAVDVDALFEIATKSQSLIRIEKEAGQFVVEGSDCASVSGATLNDALIAKVNEAFVLGSSRTMLQDISYGIRQIVDVALKALSPGVNDTTTAINCIDYLGAILCHLGAVPILPALRLKNSDVGVVGQGMRFDALANEAFSQIRQNAEGNVSVLIRLLSTFRVILGRVNSLEDHTVIQSQAALIWETAQRTVPSAQDLKAIENERDRVLGAG